MVKTFIKLALLFILTIPVWSFSQFRTRDRMDRLEGFDDQKFSYGFSWQVIITIIKLYSTPPME